MDVRFLLLVSPMILLFLNDKRERLDASFGVHLVLNIERVVDEYAKVVCVSGMWEVASSHLVSDICRTVDEKLVPVRREIAFVTQGDFCALKPPLPLSLLVDTVESEVDHGDQQVHRHDQLHFQPYLQGG